MPDDKLPSPDQRPAWLRDYLASAAMPPERAREPLVIDGAVCGSVEPELARQMSAAGLGIHARDGRWIVQADAPRALDDIARWLHAGGHGGRWRDEALAVTDEQGRTIGRIERAAVRALGLATRAVHLVGHTTRGEVWVQRRALDKSVDPGMLDTLVGGLASADEDTAHTLERETWEEAGLRLAQLRGIERLHRLTVRRPVSDGYMVEHIEAFEAELADGIEPSNQDGEVMAFEKVSPAELVAALAHGHFTLEATLIHAAWLERRGLL